MKNLKFLIVILVAIAYSCNDAIDIEQPGRLGADQAFQSLTDLQTGLLGAYASLDNSGLIQFSSVFTDEVSIGVDSGGQGLGNGEYGFIVNPGTTAPNAYWVGAYAALNSFNRLIIASQNIEIDASEQGELNEILGQVYALRAYVNLLIVTYFSTDMTDNGALAGILIDFVPGVDEQLPRSTNGEFYAQITADLDRAAGLLTTQSNPTFVSLDFVTAVRARMEAYRGNYAAALPLASSLVASNPLANRAQYEGVFLDTDNTEIIFKLERTLGDPFDRQAPTGSAAGAGWVGANYAFVDGTIDGSPYFEMGRSLFNLIDPADIRFDVNINETSLISPDYQNDPDFAANDVLVIGKYPGNETELMNDLKIFRTSEMVMIMAEAYADAGSINGATNSTAAMIKMLRDARFGSDQPLPVYADQTEAFGAILDERRVEFAFEGHRYPDLKRLGERGNRGVLRDPLDCAVNGACSLPASDFRFTLPIPIAETNANPDIQQNPGY